MKVNDLIGRKFSASCGRHERAYDKRARRRVPNAASRWLSKRCALWKSLTSNPWMSRWTDRLSTDDQPRGGRERRRMGIRGTDIGFLTTRVPRTHSDSDAHDVVDLDSIARLHVMILDGFGSHAYDVNLPVGIVHIREVHVPRDQAVDTERLNPLENRVPSYP